jgi:hypothetical protein
MLLALVIGVAALAFGVLQLSRMSAPARRRAIRIRLSYEEARSELGRGVRLEELSIAGACPLCRESVEGPTSTACPTCALPHHPDCWSWNGGCAVYACASRRVPKDA